jgi:hypothetical protein
VIPTREGAHTLGHTLQTCLDQTFDDYEVVVCDNHSSPATRQVVDGLGSPRIKYLRSPRPLSMSANWELAVAHAAGEYVTVLGDDDGLLPHALRVLDHLVRQTQARAVRWDAAFYLWPTIALPGEANYLRLPLGSEVRTLDGRAVIASVIAFEQCYTTLPMLYNAVVHRGLLDALRRRLGRLFLTRYPDVCSGFLVAHEAGTYASVRLPMSVAGQSDKSIGIGHHFLPGKSAVGDAFVRMNADEGVGVRRTVPDLHVFPVVPVADCFLAAREALFPDDDGLRLDRKTVATHCVWCLRTGGRAQWDRCMATIRDTLADDPSLLAWFDATFADFPPSVTGPLPLRSPVLGFDGDQLHLNADAFGVADVHGAAQLCEKVLCCRDADLSRRFRSGAAPRASDLLHQQLREKESVIQELSAAVKHYRQLLAQREQAGGESRATPEGAARKLRRLLARLAGRVAALGRARRAS